MAMFATARKIQTEGVDLNGEDDFVDLSPVNVGDDNYTLDLTESAINDALTAQDTAIPQPSDPAPDAINGIPPAAEVNSTEVTPLVGGVDVEGDEKNSASPTRPSINLFKTSGSAVKHSSGLVKQGVASQEELSAIENSWMSHARDILNGYERVKVPKGKGDEQFFARPRKDDEPPMFTYYSENSVLTVEKTPMVGAPMPNLPSDDTIRAMLFAAAERFGQPLLLDGLSPSSVKKAQLIAKDMGLDVNVRKNLGQALVIKSKSPAL